MPGQALKPVFPGRNRDSEPLGLPFPPDGASQLALNRHLAKFVAKPGMDRGLKQFLTSGFLPAYREQSFTSIALQTHIAGRPAPSPMLGGIRYKLVHNERERCD